MHSAIFFATSFPTAFFSLSSNTAYKRRRVYKIKISADDVGRKVKISNRI